MKAARPGRQQGAHHVEAQLTGGAEAAPIGSSADREPDASAAGVLAIAHARSGATARQARPARRGRTRPGRFPTSAVARRAPV